MIKFPDIYKSKFYAQQCEKWMAKCDNDDCPMSEYFHHIITIHKALQASEYHNKNAKEFPDET